MFRAVAAMILMTGLFAGTAGAEGNIHIGQMEIHPFLSLKEIFSDNIYSTSTDEKSDSILEISPGVRMQMPIRMHRFAAEYWAIDRRYSTYKGEDTTNQHAKGLLDLKFGSRVSLIASGAYDKGHEPRSSSASGFIEVFRTNTGYGSATYQLTGRSKVQVEYTQTAWNYSTSSFRDRDEGLTSGYFYYRFLPKTSVFVEYDHKAIDYTDPTSGLDSTENSTLVGIQWEITAKSRGTIKAGWMSKDYKDPAGKDFSGPRWSLNIDHKFSEDSSVVLSGQRQVNEANAVGVAYYTTTGLYGEFSFRFLSKTAFLLRGSYSNDVYSNAVPPATVAREDTYSLAGVGLKYFMKDWIDLGADYNKRNRDSNIDVNDYKENQYVLYVKMSF
jgi:polysaccharide biosynthesis protein VpsM